MYKVLRIIILLGSLVALILGIFVFKDSEHVAHELSVHLFSELIILFVATFIVERAVDNYKEKEKEKKWASIKDSAQLELALSACAFMNSVHIHLYTFTDVTLKEKNRISLTLQNIETMRKHDIKKALKDMSLDLKKNFLHDLAILRENLNESIFLYKDIMPPKVFERCIEVRTAVNDFYFDFARHINYLERDIVKDKRVGNENYFSLEEDINNCNSTVEVLLNLLISEHKERTLK